MIEITEAELAEEALAADPDAPLPADAVPFGPPTDDGPLPGWYMPGVAVTGAGRRGWRRGVALAIVVSFTAINAAGLCNTYADLISGM